MASAVLACVHVPAQAASQSTSCPQSASVCNAESNRRYGAYSATLQKPSSLASVGFAPQKCVSIVAVAIPCKHFAVPQKAAKARGFFAIVARQLPGTGQGLCASLVGIVVGVSA